MSVVPFPPRKGCAVEAVVTRSPAGKRSASSLFLASNDVAAKAVVAKLIEQIGLAPVESEDSSKRALNAGRLVAR